VIDIYIDDGKTGTDFDRSDYVRLEEDIFSKAVNCMIVKDLNRYARNIADGITALDDFVLKHKLRFISLGIIFVVAAHQTGVAARGVGDGHFHTPLQCCFIGPRQLR